MPTLERDMDCRRCERITRHRRETIAYPRGFRGIGLAPVVWFINATIPWACAECAARDEPDD